MSAAVAVTRSEFTPAQLRSAACASEEPAQVRRLLAIALVLEGVPRRFCQNSCQTRRREVKAEFSLRRFENSEHTAGTTQVKQATAAGRDVLVVAGARAEEVAELVIASTEALR